MAVITGTSGNDTLAGTTANDEILGLEGNDNLAGNNGNDVLDGGAGADVLNGGAGTDTATYANSGAAVTVNLTAGTASGGDAQGDTLTAVERVIGSSFGDTLTSSTAGHTLEGSVGDDIYVVGNASVTVVEVAGAGDDEVRTNLATYTLGANVERLTYTGTAAFTGTGNALDNVITGGVGADTLRGAAGADHLIGGGGNDTATYAGSAAITFNLKTGVHTGDAAGDTFDSIEIFVGSSGNDTFVGTAAADRFNGGAAGTDTIDYSTSGDAVNVNLTTNVNTGGDAQGDNLTLFERVVGSTFNDTLSSSTAGHTLEGGADHDIYVVGNASVSVVEAVDGGYDEVRTALATLTLDENVEFLTYTGGAVAFTGIGNDSDNIIVGGTGGDTLRGEGGGDQLFGGAGTDTAAYGSTSVTIDLFLGNNTGDAEWDTFDSIERFTGSTAADKFVANSTANYFNGSGGVDIIDYSWSVAGVNVNFVTNTHTGGDAQGDTLLNFEHVIGSFDGNDTLTSSTVGHILEGLAGNDVYVVGNASVQVIEEFSTGWGDDEVRTALASYTLSANVERLTYTGTTTAAFTGIGNDENNVITGNNGNDTLRGGYGADQLNGGGGTDTAAYGTTSVVLDFKTGDHQGDAAGDVFNSIERFTGSSVADTFISGSSGEYFNGSSGVDTADYSQSAAAVTVNLTSGTGAGGDAQGDTLVLVEHVIGSSFGDTFTSSTAGHVLEGGDSSDIYIIGVAGVQVVEHTSFATGVDEIQTSLLTFTNVEGVEVLKYTGTGAFTGIGSIGNETIYGGVGNDTLRGEWGSDHLVGGAGTDTASYDTAVSINLKTGEHTGDAFGDTYESIEIIFGSGSADTFAGNGSANNFNGGAGFDTIDYTLSDVAVNVNLATNAVNTGGDAQGDILTSIERVVGSFFDDTLSSSTNGHTLEGYAGNDIYIVGTAGVDVIDLDGTDEIRTALVTFTNVDGIETLRYTGTAAFTGIGSIWNETIYGGAGNDTLRGEWGSDHLVGGAGTDTASYDTAVSINLKTGWHEGDAGGDTYDSIEIILGSGFADTFAGDANANTFNGGGGIDTIDYSLSDVAVNVNFMTNVNTGGDAQGDVLSSIERVFGSVYDDTLLSSTSGHTLEGWYGNDVYVIGHAGVNVVESVDDSWSVDEVQTALAALTLDANVEKLTYTGNGNFTGTGSATDNIITSGVGNDTLRGEGGNDILNGGDGNDQLLGGEGADHFNGGDGADVASYADSAVGVTINLDTGSSGIAEGDTYENIETIRGSNYTDIFFANADANNFHGGSGTGGDVYDIISYENSTEGITIDFSTGTSTGIAAGDVLTSVEIIRGTTFLDTIIGTTTGDIIIGDANAETIDGSGGLDIVFYGESTEKIEVNLATGETGDFGDANGDTLVSIEGIIGTGYNDEITGTDGANNIQGGWGTDIIDGGAGNDTIHGLYSTDIPLTFVRPNPLSIFVDEDRLYGGIGNDTIYTGGDDLHTIAYGDAGDDTIVAHVAEVHGGAGIDTITAHGDHARIYGDGGNDILNIYYDNYVDPADGGEDSDQYFIESTHGATIRDTGNSGEDRVQLRFLDTGDDARGFTVNDHDLLITSQEDLDDNGVVDYGVILKNWFVDGAYIEAFFDGNGVEFQINVA